MTKTEMNMLIEVNKLLTHTSKLDRCRNELKFDELMGEFKERLDNLFSLNYEESRVEEIINQVILAARAKLVELVKKENQLKKEEKEAQRLVDVIKYNRGFLDHDNINNRGSSRTIEEQLTKLQRLLTDEAKISTALAKVGKDLRKLMEKIKE